MKTYNIKLAKKRFEELINETINHDKVIKITGSTANAILISESKWNSIKETLFLLSITGMRESIKKGMNTSLDEFNGEVVWWERRSLNNSYVDALWVNVNRYKIIDRINH